jgi:hypothetical protein
MRIEDTRFYGFGGVGNSQKKIGNVALPNFNSVYFYTKTASTMSNEKYKEAIIAQAQKDEARGVSYSKSPESMSLMKSYTSVASPDRKAIITNGLNQLFGNSNALAVKKASHLNLIEILLGKTQFTNKGSKAQLTYAEFKDSNGNVIADYANGGWTMYPTAAENARSDEFLQIYRSAWESSHNGNGTSTQPSGVSEQSIDIVI